MYNANQPFKTPNEQFYTNYKPLNLDDKDEEYFDLTLDDQTLGKQLWRSIEQSVDHWNQKPWNLDKVDEETIKYFLGDQVEALLSNNRSQKYVDNRLFSSVRAILAYITSQLAKPEVVPSKNDLSFIKAARSVELALYEHSTDELVDHKVRVAVLSLLLRKRGFLKLVYNPDKGLYGDVETLTVDASDIVVDWRSKYLEEPKAVHEKMRMTVEEWLYKFPDKKAEMYSALGFQRGVDSQMTKVVPGYESWFSYYDDKGCQYGVAWHWPQHKLVLGSTRNPNWVYTGDEKKQKEANVTPTPCIPYVSFNYLNLGRGAIDETSLFEQAKPLQDIVNRREYQLQENADYANGRWVASSKVFTEQDAGRFINKNPKTIGLVNSDDIAKDIKVFDPTMLPSYVYQSLLDTRNEIDTMMGTPAIFRGETPDSSKSATLGRDLIMKQQAGHLQDDLVKVINASMSQYYLKKLQMMRVYYTDDYWFQVKGSSGKYDYILINGDSIDSNVKLGVQMDSTLPLDKQSIRTTALTLAQMGKIDDLTLFEDLGLPDADKRAERLQRWTMDKYGYLNSIEQDLDNNDAEVDIMLLVANKQPEERDDYDEDYLNYITNFISKNRFVKLPSDAKMRIIMYMQQITQIASRTEMLQQQSGAKPQADAYTGMIEEPIMPPMPRVNVRLNGNLDPTATDKLAGMPPPAPTAPAAPVPGAAPSPGGAPAAPRL